MKKLLLSAALVSLLASPALAQRPEVNPNFTYPYPQARAHTAAPQATRAYDYAPGFNAYGMAAGGAAGRNANSSALTGGGSDGYDHSLIESIQ